MVYSKPISVKVSPAASKAAKKPIPKQSPKRKKLDTVYNVLAKSFKERNPYCMARLEGCTGITSDVHHPYSGASRLKYYLDDSEFIAVCTSCHRTIHDKMSKEQLYELGLKKTH